MSAGDRKRPARALGVVAALAVSVAIAACGSDGGEDATAPGEGGFTGHAAKQTIPAEIDEKPQGFVSSDLLRPLVNAWRTSSHDRLTEVDAGALATDKSIGALAIFRHEFASSQQYVVLVKVKDSGALRITGAPLGRKAGTSAQDSGEIDFVGARGVRGTLHLSDDTVSLRKP